MVTSGRRYVLMFTGIVGFYIGICAGLYVYVRQSRRGQFESYTWYYIKAGGNRTAVAVLYTVCSDQWRNSDKCNKNNFYKTEIVRATHLDVVINRETNVFTAEEPANGNTKGSARVTAESYRGQEMFAAKNQGGTEEKCNMFWKATTTLLKAVVSTNLTQWGFKKRVECPTINLTNITPVRDKVVLDCTRLEKRLEKTNSSSDIFEVEFGDECLQKIIAKCCQDEQPVPNVIHYIWYGNQPLGYFQFLSYMSVLRFMKPCLFLLHGEFLPHGVYWDYFINIYPNVIHVRRSLITHLYGHKLRFKEHGADVMRIEAIKKYGGMYIDWDQVLLRPIEPLRQYEFTTSKASKQHFTNGVLIGKRNASFLNLWHRGYQNYTGSWGGNSLFYPFQLALKYPHLVHVEGFNFTRPAQPQVIFNTNYDWSTNYAMHLYIRFYKKLTDMNVVRKLNSTIGAVSRHILYGNKELCSN